jgi:hypothetical protein
MAKGCVIAWIGRSPRMQNKVPYFGVYGSRSRQFASDHVSSASNLVRRAEPALNRLELGRAIA